MPLHLGPRWHAFTRGLFRPKEHTETYQLFGHVHDMFVHHNLASDDARDELLIKIIRNVFDALELKPGHKQSDAMIKIINRLADYEVMFVLPEIDWDERRTVAEWWELRDQLTHQKHFLEHFDDTITYFEEAVTQFFAFVLEACPTLLAEGGDEDDITITSQLIDNVADIDRVSEQALALFFHEELKEAGLFMRVSGRLEYNLIATSGGNPNDPKSFNRALKLPTKSDIKNPRDLIGTYLGGTPLYDYFEQEIDFSLPTSSRFEHHHIVAGSGHGKTQTLQYMIAKDLEAVARGNRTVIVLDSQGDLINNIANLAEFGPDGPLHDRVVIIDPTDVEWPVSLNLFDVGVERLSGYEPLERERLTNSILELYDFVLGTLLSAEMTQKQSVIFRYVTRLMLHIPNATIHTFRELMEPGSQIKFAKDIAKLTGTAKHFFETEFASREFEQTKKQVLRRLWGILENQTFERMFAHPRSKLDLFHEMNSGKVILINTAKDLLKEQGTEIFGRFFIAMIAQAAQERATLPENKRMPTLVYIDEAADYFDCNIGIILAQARKYNVGMVLAHQYLGQLEPRLQDAFAANTSIKFAGGVSAKDARLLAPMLYCDPGFIEAQGKGNFAAHVRGVTKSAVPLHFPFGYLEQKPRMSASERKTLRAKMRKHYAVHYSDLAREEGNKEEVVDANETSPESGDDGTEAGYEL